MEYKIKPMKLGELLDTSIKVFTNNFLLFSLIGGVWILGFVAIIFVGLAPFFGLGGRLNPETLNASVISEFFPILMLFFVFLIFFLQYLATAALTKAISDRYLGHPVSFVDSYKTAFSRFLALLGTLMLAGLVLFAGFLLLVVPGFILMCAFVILPPIVILENKSGMEALKRAWFLMKGNKGKAFLIMIIVGLVQQLTAILGIIPIPIVNVVLQLAMMVVFFAFGQVAMTLIYFHARCQKEAFDVELLAKEVPTV